MPDTCRFVKYLLRSVVGADADTALALGELEMNEEFFGEEDDPAYDEECLDAETDWRRKEFPEAFTWQCCNEPSDGKPCLIQKHMPRLYSILP